MEGCPTPGPSSTAIDGTGQPVPYSTFNSERQCVPHLTRQGNQWVEIASATKPPEGPATTSTRVETTATKQTGSESDIGQRPSQTTSTSREATSGTNTPTPIVFSSAKVGGIAAGAAIGGIVVASLVFIICYLLLKKRRRYGKVQIFNAPKEYEDAHQSRPVVLERLPQRLADECFRQKLRKLQTDIKNCVDNFFPHKPLQLDTLTETELQSLAGSPINGSSWQAELLQDGLRPRIIRSLIAQILFMKIDPRFRSDSSLLPSDILAMYKSLQAPKESRERSQNTDTSGREEYLAIWRQITCHYTPIDCMSEQNRRSVDSIASGLTALRPEPYDGFCRNLEGLVADTSQLGLELFASPDEWEATWARSAQDDQGGVVVFPGVFFARKERSENRHQRTSNVLVQLTRCIIE